MRMNSCLFLSVVLNATLPALAPGQGAAVSPRASGPAGDPRGWLMALAGDYVTENEFSPAPGAPSRRSPGRATLTPVLDGKFLREESTTERPGGRAQGLKLWGYDTASGKFQAAWTYTGATSILLLQGDAAGPAVQYTGEYQEPETGRHTLRVELLPLDGDHFSLVLRSFGEDGAARATLRTTYTRVRTP